MSGVLNASVLSHGEKLNTAPLVTVRSRFVERAPLLLGFFLFSHLFSSRIVTRRVLFPLRLNVLISFILVLLRLKNGALLCKVSDVFAVISMHVIAVVPGCMHGDITACDWL